MLTFFTWTPHHDHHETGRYRNTRVSLFPGANFLLQGQNYHLIHHMVPGIPYYRYRSSFEEMRPLLERNGVRIEGWWPDGGARKAERQQA
jgi:fatty acid desaturase